MKKGFTLAEVLITLSVIGVVAAITIPTLVSKIMDKVFTEAKSNSLMKITEATKQMKSNDLLSGYATNDAFVDVFQKYMKVTNRCDSSNLTKCFPAKFKTGSGETVLTSTLITGPTLDANNVGNNTLALMLANGTSVLFTLRDPTKVGTACDRIDPYDNQTDTTSCMSFLYDINGYGSPNTMGKDIGSVNVNVSACDGTRFDALCVAVSDVSYSPLNTCSGGTPEDKAFDPTGDTNTYCATNYWAGAKKACKAQSESRLPTKDELNTIYQNKGTIGGLYDSAFDQYMSSTESDSMGIWTQYMIDGFQDTNYKKWQYSVRCVK